MFWLKKIPMLAWGGLALVLVVAAILWLANRDEHNQDLGAATQREGDLREVLERTEKGNEIRETIRVNPTAAYNECLQSARTPENCVGLLPDGSDHHDGASAESRL